ncbi:KV401 protein, partial [Polypterus senegalus]
MVKVLFFECYRFLTIYPLHITHILGSSAEIHMTQTPPIASVQLGEKGDINCKASSSISNYIAWYLLRPGEKPKILKFNSASSCWSGIPVRFTGTQSGTSFTLTISGFQAEDVELLLLSTAGQYTSNTVPVTESHTEATSISVGCY